MIEHIWSCTCGTDTSCDQNQMNLGEVFKCPGCDHEWACIRTKNGPKIWIKIYPEDSKFYDIFGEPNEE